MELKKTKSTTFHPDVENTNRTSNTNKQYIRRNTRLSSSYAVFNDHDMLYEVPLTGSSLHRTTKDRVKFSTGSSYIGQWDSLGMSGRGDYKYSHGVLYRGDFFDGLFDGYGALTYPQMQVFSMFCSGNVLKRTIEYIFSDGLCYQEPWTYCQMPDRRYLISIENGLQPAGQEYLTNDPTPRKIPDGCYDAGDGFFDPHLKVVFSPSNRQKILRIPTPSEEDWIVKNCRKAWDEPTRYRPDLYEYWCSGRLEEAFNKRNSSDTSFKGVQ